MPLWKWCMCHAMCGTKTAMANSATCEHANKHFTKEQQCHSIGSQSELVHLWYECWRADHHPGSCHRKMWKGGTECQWRHLQELRQPGDRWHAPSGNPRSPLWQRHGMFFWKQVLLQALVPPACNWYMVRTSTPLMAALTKWFRSPFGLIPGMIKLRQLVSLKPVRMALELIRDWSALSALCKCGQSIVSIHPFLYAGVLGHRGHVTLLPVDVLWHIEIPATDIDFRGNRNSPKTQSTIAWWYDEWQEP